MEATIILPAGRSDATCLKQQLRDEILRPSLSNAAAAISTYFLAVWYQRRYKKPMGVAFVIIAFLILHFLFAILTWLLIFVIPLKC